MRTPSLIALLVLLWPGASISAQDADLFEPLRVLEFRLDFQDANWRTLLDRHVADEQDIPADLTFDGVVYPRIGVRYKGNSSLRVPSLKKPFNLSIDAYDEDQRLVGLKTLNLSNGFMDPSMVREVLFYEIARRYVPTPRTSFVRLYLEGEYWGLYTLVEQTNKDFLGQWFDRKSGNLYKGDAPDEGPRGRPDLTWRGSDPQAYAGSYQLKTEDSAAPFEDIVQLADALNNAPASQFSDAISAILDTDRALWYVALSNVFVNLDSYLGSGHNFYLYNDPDSSVFHLLLWDTNEAFGTFGFGGGPDGEMSLESRYRLSPMHNSNAGNRPLVRRLLGASPFRARYLAHVRTVLEQELDSERLAERIDELQTLIRPHLAADPHRLFSMAEFERNAVDSVRTGGGRGRTIPGLLSLVEERGVYLRSHPEIRPVAPRVEDIEISPSAPTARDVVRVVASLGSTAAGARCFAHYRPWPGAWTQVELLDDGAHADGEMSDGAFGGELPAAPAGVRVEYYFEAVGPGGVTAFSPRETTGQPLSYVVELPLSSSLTVVINEIQASNENGPVDPQGDHDDWIELLNTSDDEVDLSLAYLTDRADRPRKWQIPQGTRLAPGEYLIVWADEDGSDTPGLHANFKLSSSGELVYLVDSDERGNTLLDSLEFGELATDQSRGRLPDGSGEFRTLWPTPGAPNSAVPVDGTFLRGDANGDGTVDISDPVSIVIWLFVTPVHVACLDAADANDDGAVDVSDAIRVLDSLFLEGEPPRAPHPDCGADPTADDLSCTAPSACAL